MLKIKVFLCALYHTLYGNCVVGTKNFRSTMDRFESDRIGSNRIDATTLARPTHLIFLLLFSFLMSSLLACVSDSTDSFNTTRDSNFCSNSSVRSIEERKSMQYIYNIVLLYGIVY